ncbi:MAG: heavy-metal-associated domain-containing protein, partial [Proteobacteria bacterium]|nr:heavy-metal-associated domain-containing protein [Pseudomonadota bacterium]
MLPLSARIRRPGPAVLLLGGLGMALAVVLALVGPARLIAQIEGDRGIVPVAASRDIQVDGIEVNVTGDTGQEARLKGWEEAAKLAWAKIGGPAMGDGQIQSMVS